MRTLIIALLTLTSTLLFAQNKVTWLGGTPGQETKWNEARNWSNNQVPDEFSFVIIKQHNSGHNAQPVLKESVEVASIEIYSGATLTIKENGEVLIDGSYNTTNGIANYGGQLINEGLIDLQNMDDFSSDHLKEAVKGNGEMLVNGQPLNDIYFTKN